MDATEHLATHEYFFGLESPLDAIPAAGQMRAANLRGFSDYVRSRGGAPRRMLERYDIDPIVLADPDSHIACKSVVAIFEHCSLLFDDPLFGLRLAEVQDADVFGCVNALCRAAPDMRTAVSCLIDYLPLVHSPEAVLELAELGQEAELRWAVRSDLGFNDQANYQTILLILKLLRTVSSGRFQASRVNLCATARAHDLPEIDRLIGAPVQMGAAQNSIAFSAAMLDLPINSADRLIFRLLGGYLARLRIINRVNIVERTQSYVSGALPTGTCHVERCAEKLGLSVRSLQVKLAARGLSFSEIVENQREQLAIIYLGQTRMPLDEVAERLGYAEQTSFGRAFKRWTGQTPRTFRSTSC
jgi:AraC-like DNA-binding protein